MAKVSASVGDTADTKRIVSILKCLRWMIMRKYEILLLNNKTGEALAQECHKITFAEAARAAYLLVRRKGFDWKIKSVHEV